MLRYTVLNPVRAKMVERPEDHRWSSYRAGAGLKTTPEWLALDSIAKYFGEPAAWQANYRSFVAEKLSTDERLWDKVKCQLYLGTEAWVASMRKVVESKLRGDDHPRVQRTVGHPEMAVIIEALARAMAISARAIRETRGGAARMLAAGLGWYEGLHGLRPIAAALRLRSSGHVSDLVRACERELRRDAELRVVLDAAFEALS